MLKKTALIISILLFTSHFYDSYGQELNIDPLYRIQLLTEMRNYDSAIEFAEKLGDTLKCEKYEILGLCYSKLYRYDQAVKYYENYISVCNPSSIQFINLGDNYVKLKKLDKAKEQFLKVDGHDSNYSLAQFNIGVLEYKRENYKVAAEYFTIALNVAKGKSFDFDYLEMLLRTLIKLEEYDVAIRNVDSVLEFWEKDSIEYNYTTILKSTIFEAKGEFNSAMKLLEDIIKSGIENEDMLIEAYSSQIRIFSKMEKEKKLCKVYSKLKDIKPDARILEKYKCL